MHFEAHLTIANIPDFELGALAHKHAMKYLHILLPSGVAPSQPMLTWRFSADSVVHAEIELGRRAQKLGLATGDIVRLKLESERQELAITNSETTEPLVYLEQHIKACVPPSTYPAMLALAAEHEAHLSRNSRSTSSAEVRYFTQRFAAGECSRAASALTILLNALAATEIAVLRTEREYVHIDTRLALDNGWATP
jgi:hypothetical protein